MQLSHCHGVHADTSLPMYIVQEGTLAVKCKHANHKIRLVLTLLELAFRFSLANRWSLVEQDQNAPHTYYEHTYPSENAGIQLPEEHSEASTYWLGTWGPTTDRRTRSCE